MPIDQCPHSFSHLASVVLPSYMVELRQNIHNPLLLSMFSRPGTGVRSLLRQFGRESDFPGCYVLIEGGNPIYVGISRSVFSRLRQHVNGKTHFDASLAYRIAATKAPHNQNRGDAMKDPAFQRHFNAAKTYLSSLNVAYVEIFNPLELYLFEAYCAMELDTSTWNTFETH